MNFSKNPKNNLLQTEKFYRSPAIFMQLGLVLALLIVYITLQYASTKTIIVLNDSEPDVDPTYVFQIPPNITIERKSKPQDLKQPKKVILVEPEIVPNNTSTEILPDLNQKETTTTDEKIENIIEVIDPPEVTEPIDFIVLEKAPIFPGCEGLEEKESKACFTEKMKKFVNKKFNSSLAERLNLIGKQRIYAQFTIDKHGLVTDIKIRAPHKTLEKEALRVIKNLPEMIPGKQRKKAVPVKYTLPIVFEIQ